MHTVVLRGPGLAIDTPPASPPRVTRLLTVTATYLLSADGRKAALLAGGNGRAVQELSVDVPANLMHLVTVDDQGVARLKLRPRYDRDDKQRVIRVDAAPTYDRPPSLEDLFHEAARNHELERAHQQQRAAARTERRDAQRQLRVQLARAFLSDRIQRALVHPAPSPKRQIAEWIAVHGTSQQQDRQAAGVLPMAEVIEAMTDDAFAVLGNRPRYLRDGVNRLQAHLRQSSRYANVVVTPADLGVTSKNAGQAMAAQWALVQEMQAALPDATVALRVASPGVEAGSSGANPDDPWGACYSEVRLVHIAPRVRSTEYEVSPHGLAPADARRGAAAAHRSPWRIRTTIASRNHAPQVAPVWSTGATLVGAVTSARARRLSLRA